MWLLAFDLTFRVLAQLQSSVCNRIQYEPCCLQYVTSLIDLVAYNVLLASFLPSELMWRALKSALIKKSIILYMLV